MRFSDFKHGLQHGFWLGLGMIFLVLIGLPSRSSADIAGLTLPLFLALTFYIGWRLTRNFRDKRLGLLNALAAGLTAALLLLLFLGIINRWHARGVEVKRNYFDQMDTYPLHILSGVPDEELGANPEVNPVTGEYREGARLRTNPMALYVKENNAIISFLGFHLGGLYGLAILLVLAAVLGSLAERAASQVDWAALRSRADSRTNAVTNSPTMPVLRRWGALLLPLLFFVLFWATYPHRLDSDSTFQLINLNRLFNLTSGSIIQAPNIQLGLIFLVMISGVAAVRAAEMRPSTIAYPARLVMGLVALGLMWLLAVRQITVQNVVFINPSYDIGIDAKTATTIGMSVLLLAIFWFYARGVRDHERFEIYFTVLLVAGLMLLMPLYMDQYQSSTMGRIALFIMFALGLNIVVGYAGLLDLGYVAFYAIGAYTFAFVYQGTNVAKMDIGQMNNLGWLLLSAVIFIPLVIAIGTLLLQTRPTPEATRSDSPIKHQRAVWDKQPPALISLGLIALAIAATLIGRWLITDVLNVSAHEFSPFAIAGAVAMIVCALAGITLGVPVLRLRGDYLAIVTLGFGEIISLTLNNLEEVTGGPRGVLGIPKPIAPGTSGPASSLAILYITLLGTLIVMLVSTRFRSSRLGRAWLAMRSDEDIAQAMGINLVNTKLLAFSIGASFAGLAGVIFASRQSSIFPQDFTLLISINVLAVVIIGGMASIPGVIVGSIILVGLPELLRPVEAYRIMLFGALLVVMMIVRPVGLMPSPPPELEEEARRLAEKGAA